MRHKRHDVNLLIGIYRDDHPSYRDATRFVRPPRPQLANTMWGRMQDTVNTFVYSYSRDLVGCWLMLVWPPINMGVGQNLLLSILMGWTSIYQLFWCSPGVQGFDPSPYRHQYMDSFEHRVPLNPPVHHHFPILSRQNLAWKKTIFGLFPIDKPGFIHFINGFIMAPKELVQKTCHFRLFFVFSVSNRWKIVWTNSMWHVYNIL